MTHEETTELLKELIINGEKPLVVNCSRAANPETFTLGMLEDLGWMNKRYITDYEGDVEEIERSYYGPKPFLMATLGAKEPREINPGDEFTY